jgi:WD40 repeat protein
LLRGYTVHEVLGEGAFGRVYAATQPGTNREVAIKAIRPDLVNGAEFIQRFEAEAQLVARLEHPHIVPLYDYWREPGGAYLVFRLLLGGTAFGAMVSNGPFSVARVSRLVEEVGSALLAAHTAGVVHCDIKPSNVLFDESGNGYLSDFGIAIRSVAHDHTGDRTRVYAAPELVDRSGDTVRSDIFSFGCMLWELLVGASPLAVMRPSNYSRLPSLAGTMAESSEMLDAVLARATSADPESRFESMADLIVAWRDAVGRPEGVLTPIGGRFVVEPDSSRRRAVRALSIAASSAVNPYKGLRAFAEADAADFFGRDDVATALREMLIAKSFVAVVGASGSGKSSLVHAGLIPLLRNEGARVAVMVPGDRPTSVLRQALRQVAATDSNTNDPSEMVKKAVADGAGQIVLVIDQFEECWTLAEPSERERFLSAVMVAGQFGVRCVTTIRADLYDRPLQHALIGQIVADGTFALPLLGLRALEEAIVRPAERNGVDFDDGVVTAIVAEANAQPAGLPLLQFAMAELYEHRIDNRVTATTLHQLGGLGGSIGRRAEDIYTSLDEDLQAHTRQLFGRLVAPGYGIPDIRRRARIGELSEPDRIVADRFVHARLLVADRDHATREPVIEVAHEALLANWARLREWLETDRRWLAQLQHLATATRTWDETGRPDGELYRGSRLEAVIEALPERGQQLSPSEQAFVDASRTARDAGRDRERRDTRRLRRFLITTACLLALALVAGTIAFTQRQQARTTATRAQAAQRDAEIAALVGRSLLIRGSQRDTAALLAIEAYRQADTPRTRSALLSTFTTDVGYLGTDRLPESLTGRRAPGDVVAADGIVLPDGKTTLVMGPDERFRPYNLDSGAVGEPWPALTDFPPGDSRFASSTDGRFVAQMFWYTSTAGSTVLGVFDTTTHEPVIGPINIDFRADNAVFSLDDARLYVSGGNNGTLVEYSLANGKEVGRLAGLQPPGDSFLSATIAGLAFVTGGLLAVGSVAGPVRVVDPLTLAVAYEIDAPRGTTERFFAIDNGTALIGAGLFGQVRLDVTSRSSTPVWQVDTSDLNRTGPAQPDDCVAFAVAERLGHYYCGGSSGHVEERDLRTGGFVRQLNGQNVSTGSIWLAGSETELVSFSGNDAAVNRWRLDGSGPITRRIGDGYWPISYSPDGKLLLADSGSGAFGDSSHWLVVDPQTGNREVEPPGAVQLPNWRADGTLNGIIGSDAAPRFATLDPRTRQWTTMDVALEEKPNDGFGSRHRAWLFYPSSNARGQGEIWTIDTDTHTRIEPTLHVVGFVNGSGTDSGDRIAVGTLSGIVVFDGRTGETLHTFSDANLRGAYIVAGKFLVAASLDGEMTVYDLETFDSVATLGGLRGLGRVKASDDGSLAVASGNERSSILYDLTSGEQIGDPIIIPDNEAIAFALRPDGKELAVGGGAGRKLTVWDLDPQHWITEACKFAGRNLTPQEWKTDIGDLAPYHRTCPDYD